MSYLTDYILNTRYLRYNEKTFDDISRRVADYIGNDENERNAFYDIMTNKEFVPGGRTIACAGTDKKLIPNCVVLPVEDTLDGIFDTLKRAAILQQSGCVIAGTQVLTDKGNVLIEEHVDETLNVWNGSKFTPAVFKITGHDKNVYKVTLNDNNSLICTADHKWILRNGTRVNTTDLLINDELLLSLTNYNNININEKTNDETFETENVAEVDPYIAGVLFAENDDANTIYICDLDDSKEKMIQYLSKHLLCKCISENQFEFIVDDKYFHDDNEYAYESVLNVVPNIEMSSNDSCGYDDCDVRSMRHTPTISNPISASHKKPSSYNRILKRMPVINKSYKPDHNKLKWLSGIIDHIGNCTNNEIYIICDDGFKLNVIKKVLHELGVGCTVYLSTHTNSILLNEYEVKWLLSLGLQPLTMQSINIRYGSEYPKVKSVELLPQKADTVYCVTTIDDSHMATFNGILTGNCGLGFNFSTLRPAGMQCKRTGGSASGPISFMNLYSHAFKIVQQYNRSGANIGILSIEHPDILAFITMKNDLSILNNFNISVLITQEFMDALNTDPDALWYCTWNNEKVKPRYISYDRDMLVQDISEADVTVKDIWNEIVHSAWSTGEPGLLFEEHMNTSNPLKSYFGKVNSVNPCGEISLYPNECCNLGSINLEEFCDINPEYNASFDEVIKYINVNKLVAVTKTAIQFMNNVVDKLDIPDRELQLFVLILRRLGLGIMGLADMLIKLKIPYNSKIGRDVTSYVLKIINESAHSESKLLSHKYGSVADRIINPLYWLKQTNTITDETYNTDKLIIDKLLKNITNSNKIAKDKYLAYHANCACTCIAPTGSTALIHNVSSGIEPYFALVFKRSLKGKLQDEIIINKHLEQYLKNKDLYRDDIIEDIINKGINKVEAIPKHVRDIFITAQMMEPEDHVLMQIAAQKYIDNSISKTCNFPHDASEEYVAKIYNMANLGKCKGITVYRDGCRSSQVLVTINNENSGEQLKTKSLISDACSSGTCDL